MRGQVRQVPRGRDSGAILGDDGNTYALPLSEWRAAAAPVVGMAVDFAVREGMAYGIYPLPGLGEQQPGNAGLLALIAVILLIAGFVIPVLPTIAALFLGLFAAGRAKRQGNGGALGWSRFAWIAALVVLVAEVLLVVLAFKFALALVVGMASWL